MANKKTDTKTQEVKAQNAGEQTLQEKFVGVRRTAKVVKGGRVFGFSAIVVVGDGKGRVGYGQGKAREVPQAIQKAIESAKRNMRRIELKGQTIQHQIVGIHGATKVIMLPACEGTGLIAGGAMRAVCEVLGIRDVLAKCVGSRSPVNVVRATVKALESMVTPEIIAAKRGLSIKQVIGE